MFNFSFLSLVLYEILGGHKFTLGGPAPPGGFLEVVLALFYIIVNFQLRSSINARLTARSLYNRFCIERSPKIGFWRILGQMLIFGENPLGMQ